MLASEAPCLRLGASLSRIFISWIGWAQLIKPSLSAGDATFVYLFFKFGPDDKYMKIRVFLYLSQLVNLWMILKLSLFWNIGKGVGKACIQTTRWLSYRSLKERRQGLEASQTSWSRGRRRRMGGEEGKWWRRGGDGGEENHIVDIHNDSTSWIIWCFPRHQITCHSPPCPVCQNSKTTVARTFESPACLNTCWWSMKQAVPQK